MILKPEDPLTIPAGTLINTKSRDTFFPAVVKEVDRNVIVKIVYDDKPTSICYVSEDRVHGRLEKNAIVYEEELLSVDKCQLKRGRIVDVIDSSMYTVKHLDGSSNILERSQIISQGDQQISQGDEDLIPEADPQQSGPYNLYVETGVFEDLTSVNKNKQNMGLLTPATDSTSSEEIGCTK